MLGAGQGVFFEKQMKSCVTRIMMTVLGQGLSFSGPSYGPKLRAVFFTARVSSSCNRKYVLLSWVWREHMPKQESRWVCQQCNWSFARHMGKCPNCGAWDTLVETVFSSDTQQFTAKVGCWVITSTTTQSGR